MKQLQQDPWESDIPEKYKSGDIVRGTVTKLTTFGAFVELEDGLEGLLHISELSDKKISAPEEIVSIGDIVDVRVIRVEPQNRKIGLSLKPTIGLSPDSPQPRIAVRCDELPPEHAAEETSTDDKPEAGEASELTEKAPEPSAEVSEEAESAEAAPVADSAQAEQTPEAPVEQAETVELEDVVPDLPDAVEPAAEVS